ncbi:lysoplasmalogenase [soil metagenome]
MYRLLRKNIFRIFWVIVFAGLIVVSLQISWLDYIFKPLIIPLLLAALFFKTGQPKGKMKIVIALVFSFLGDVFLLFENDGPLFFIAGLVCFLLTHIFYISYFLQLRQSGESPVKSYPFLPILITLYSAGLLYLLWPGLKDLKIPVIIYASIISVMLYLSLCIPYKAGKIAGQLFITGAVVFVASDSLLAINKFYNPFTLAPFLIRITYCFAQYCIVKGFIKKRY